MPDKNKVLMDAAISVVRRALKRRSPGYSDQTYQNVWEKAILHFGQTGDFGKKNKNRFWRNYDKYKDDKDVSGCYVGLDRQFRKTQKGIKPGTVRATLV